jgi:phosphate/sulfate permease
LRQWSGFFHLPDHEGLETALEDRVSTRQQYRTGACLSGRQTDDQQSGVDQSKASINSLFTLPLIFSAALLSFAHGANNVANAVGPLAAINDAVFSGGVVSKASIPLWVMMVGAFGISICLALYGPKLIRTVG